MCVGCIRGCVYGVYLGVCVYLRMCTSGKCHMYGSKYVCMCRVYVQGVCRIFSSDIRHLVSSCMNRWGLGFRSGFISPRIAGSEKQNRVTPHHRVLRPSRCWYYKHPDTARQGIREYSWWCIDGH